jgi:hypothetical protein
MAVKVLKSVIVLWGRAKIILSHPFHPPQTYFPMCTMMQFRYAFWVLAIFAAALAGCGNGGSSTSPAIVANPLITFDASGSEGFSVTPDAVAGAAKVAIKVLDNNGTARAASEGVPGTAQVFNIDTAAVRPLQLQLTYLGSDGQLVVADNFRIDDRLKKVTGMPDMDVVMGLTGEQSCPNTTQDITVTTTNGVSSFVWASGTSYEVTLTCSGTVRKFVVKPTGDTNNTGTVKIYEKDQQTCLSAMSPEPVSSKEMALTSISNSATVRGYNDGSRPPTVIVKHPGCTIGVRQ